MFSHCPTASQSIEPQRIDLPPATPTPADECEFNPQCEIQNKIIYTEVYLFQIKKGRLFFVLFCFFLKIILTVHRRTSLRDYFSILDIKQRYPSDLRHSLHVMCLHLFVSCTSGQQWVYNKYTWTKHQAKTIWYANMRHFNIFDTFKRLQTHFFPWVIFAVFIAPKNEWGALKKNKDKNPLLDKFP